MERATVTATGRLVVCTGELPRDELDAVLRASSRAGISLLVTTGGSGPSRAAGGTGGVVRVHWDGISDLATLWRSAGDALRAPGVGSR